MNNPEWTKKCPECGREQSYNQKSGLIFAIKNNIKCKSCSKSGKNNPMYGTNCYNIWVEKYEVEEVNRKQDASNKKRSISLSGENNPMFGKKRPEHSKRMSGEGNPMYDKHHTQEAVDKMKKNHPRLSGENHPMYGKHHSKKTTDAISKTRIERGVARGEKNPMYGKYHSTETTVKMRNSRLNYIEKCDGQVSPNYNPDIGLFLPLLEHDLHFILFLIAKIKPLF